MTAFCLTNPTPSTQYFALAEGESPLEMWRLERANQARVGHIATPSSYSAPFLPHPRAAKSDFSLSLTTSSDSSTVESGQF
jgi:hypothetical protein